MGLSSVRTLLCGEPCSSCRSSINWCLSTSCSRWRYLPINPRHIFLYSALFTPLQTPDDARQLLAQVDSSLGKPLPEKDYGGNCLIYDANKPEDPWHNVWDKMDGFVVVHFFGWWLKVRTCMCNAPVIQIFSLIFPDCLDTGAS